MRGEGGDVSGWMVELVGHGRRVSRVSFSSSSLSFWLEAVVDIDILLRRRDARGFNYLVYLHIFLLGFPVFCALTKRGEE